MNSMTEARLCYQCVTAWTETRHCYQCMIAWAETKLCYKCMYVLGGRRQSVQIASRLPDWRIGFPNPVCQFGLPIRCLCFVRVQSGTLLCFDVNLKCFANRFLVLVCVAARLGYFPDYQIDKAARLAILSSMPDWPDCTIDRIATRRAWPDWYILPDCQIGMLSRLTQWANS